MVEFYTPCVYTTRTTSIVFECGLSWFKFFFFLFLLPSILLGLSEFSTVEGKSNPKASKLLFVLKHGDSECLIVVVNI